MLAEIITIGDELLIGQVVDTNSAWIAKQLNDVGVKIWRITSVADSKSEIKNALHESAQRAQMVIVTGGLGPTSDDITKPAVCEYFNTTLVFNPEVYQQVLDFVTKRGSTMNALNESQAWVPESCTVVLNAWGTAPCMWFEKDAITYIFLPGVPYEMKELMLKKVIPVLKQTHTLPEIYHKSILVRGIPESELAMRLQRWEQQLPSTIQLAYLPSPGMVKLRLSVYTQPKDMPAIDSALNSLRELLNSSIFGYDDDTIEKVVGNMFVKAGKTLSTAESCTGGLIGSQLTSVPGSSMFYKGGIISYSNELKINELNVDAALLSQYGAVSKEVVEAMAMGALQKFKTDVAIAVTGIAGPSGGSDEKPVGTVWIGIASDKDVVSKRYNFGDNREINRLRATIYALFDVYAHMQQLI